VPHAGGTTAVYGYSTTTGFYPNQSFERGTYVMPVNKAWVLDAYEHVDETWPTIVGSRLLRGRESGQRPGRRRERQGRRARARRVGRRDPDRGPDRDDRGAPPTDPDPDPQTPVAPGLSLAAKVKASALEQGLELKVAVSAAAPSASA